MNTTEGGFVGPGKAERETEPGKRKEQLLAILFIQPILLSTYDVSDGSLGTGDTGVEKTPPPPSW